MKRAVAPFLLFSAVRVALAANCACGYIDSNNRVWREAIVSNFTQPQGALAAVNDNWIISSETIVQSGQNQKNIEYVTGNVFQYNDALGIRASAYTGGAGVKSGEIFTERSNILYGTFRMRAVVPTVPGVVFGFFTYINEVQEQDIEFLSSDEDYYQHVYYTNQPGQLNGDVDWDAHKDVVVPGADFTAFGEHRIDWLPSASEYYYQGSKTATITKNVPNTPSELVLNVWSNGDPNFSRGPPTADAIATVQWVQLYFNSTAVSESAFNSACAAAGHVPQCRV
ncbi:SubName: Full=Uncharacterized protein {ECO:0000313/EMBL:CCA71283.1} [Serendipita indica DSM 11827]|uniref:GH16 domain-containing protein n=1 Tax=Serendipita indica (strain DSM 11827) TaxID=1109443 RepID=G4TIZ1_SERID|nr:SubName: Full=Uncharacterized protein {ECO:0000313/EMBL:CCA71283.1} [Serendipita indica DSM 11827]CCA71283.1 hypothetical protein PIIN_05222 [Serendipita indica DSM 11827]